MNDLLDCCHSKGIPSISNNPLSQGLFISPNSLESPLPGIQTRRDANQLRLVYLLIYFLKEFKNDLYNKVLSQIALNWFVYNSTLSIPGLKKLNQLNQNINSICWNSISDLISSKENVSQA